MKRIWLILWAILLLSQLLSFWLGPDMGLPVQAATFSEPGLLELAQSTDAAWQTFKPADPDSVPQAKPVLVRDRLLVREEWLLKLRDAEERLRARGKDAEISNDLEAWLAGGAKARDESPSQAMLGRYLSSLIEWMDGSTGQAGGVQLERIQVQPDSLSVYPAMVFELQGNASEIGGHVFEFIRQYPDWDLRRMELSQLGEPSGWWMMGSCVFLPGGKP